MSSINIGILGLQGDIEEHITSINSAFDDDSIDGQAIIVKNSYDLTKVHGLIIPGGESTVIGSLATTRSLLKDLGENIKNGLPILGTCAGLILLSKRTYDKVVGEKSQPILGVLDVVVERNAFGRQRESFEAEFHISKFSSNFQGVFIRAPLIRQTGDGVDVLAKLGGNIIAVQQGNVVGTCFHPELSSSLIFHKYLIEMASKSV